MKKNEGRSTKEDTSEEVREKRFKGRDAIEEKRLKSYKGRDRKKYGVRGTRNRLRRKRFE